MTAGWVPSGRGSRPLESPLSRSLPDKQSILIRSDSRLKIRNKNSSSLSRPQSAHQRSSRPGTAQSARNNVSFRPSTARSSISSVSSTMTPRLHARLLQRSTTATLDEFDRWKLAERTLFVDGEHTNNSATRQEEEISVLHRENHDFRALLTKPATAPSLESHSHFDHDVDRTLSYTPRAANKSLEASGHGRIFRITDKIGKRVFPHERKQQSSTKGRSFETTHGMDRRARRILKHSLAKQGRFGADEVVRSSLRDQVVSRVELNPSRAELLDLKRTLRAEARSASPTVKSRRQNSLARSSSTPALCPDANSAVTPKRWYGRSWAFSSQHAVLTSGFGANSRQHSRPNAPSR